MSEPLAGHPRDRLSPYLDDELGYEERSAIDRHLAGCEDCRVELEALGRLARALAEERVPAPSADLAARISRRLDAGAKRGHPALRFVVPATIAATLGAIGILVAIQWRQGLLVPPAAPPPPGEPKAADTLAAQGERVASPAPPPRNEAVAPPRQADARRPDADAKKAERPSFEEPARSSEDRKAVFSPEPGPAAPAAAPEQAAGAAAPSLAAKIAVSSPCGEHWFDSGMRAAWAVADVGAAARELERIAREAGGLGVWRGPADGRPYLLLVPRSRFEEVVDALRSWGVTGLEAVAPLPEGEGCAGISVEFQSGAPGNQPSPR